MYESKDQKYTLIKSFPFPGITLLSTESTLCPMDDYGWKCEGRREDNLGSIAACDITPYRSIITNLKLENSFFAAHYWVLILFQVLC